MEAMEDRGPNPRRRREPARPPEGRDEFNLVEFPLTLLTDRAPRAKKTLEWEDEITDKATGLPVKRRVVVTGSDAYGLPTASDNDLLFALIQLTKRANDFTSRDVRFSRYELLRLLDWRDEGRNYHRLDAGFNRWLGTSIFFSAWRDKETEAWESHKFHVLDNVSLISPDNRRILRARGQQELAFSSFSWNKVVFRNLQAGFVCPVDLETYFRLRSAISKRMLRYLGKHFRLRQRRDMTLDLRTFAFEKIGISRSYRDAGQIKKELQPAIEELEGIGFLEPMSRQRRYTRDAHGAWKIALVRMSDEAEATGPDPRAPRDAGRGPAGLEAALIARGVTPATAVELVETFPAEQIRARVDAFDWLTEAKDRRISKSPGGYLAASIRKGYAAPKGFESQADRAHRLAAEAEQRRQAEARKRRSEAEQRAREQAERARIDGYWDSLSPGAREALTADALAEANSFVLGLYRKSRKGSPEAERYLKIILDIHITGLLDGRDATADQTGGVKCLKPR
jgi:hypothetical protein